MFYGKKFLNKIKQLRKQNWSAPALMTVFILASMFLVFSFEQIGLFRKEQNLDYRTMYFDNVLKGNHKEISKLDEISEKSFSIEETLSNRVKMDSQLLKEQTYEKMMNILIEGIKPLDSHTA